MTNKPSISIFFPAYNEEKNIGRAIEESLEALSKLTDTYEVIVVDDGSRDRTAEIVKSFVQKNNHVRLVQHDKNKGYGEGLKSGIRASQYDYVFFTDSDLQFDLNELSLLTEYIPEYDVVIGYRKNRRDSFIRLINAKLWNLANKIMFGLKVRDIDCAFKLFRRDILNKVNLTSGGAMISAELLLKLHHLGASIKEVGVTHFPRTEGSPTGAKPKVIIRAFEEMWRLYSIEMGDKTQIQFLKFAIVGVLNTVTTLFVYTVLTRLGVLPSGNIFAEAISYGVGIAVSFRFNRRWTFREYWKTNYKEVLRFLSTTISALLANVLIFYTLIHFINLHDIVAVVISAVFTIAWNFILSKYWVFRK